MAPDPSYPANAFRNQQSGVDLKFRGKAPATVRTSTDVSWRHRSYRFAGASPLEWGLENRERGAGGVRLRLPPDRSTTGAGSR